MRRVKLEGAAAEVERKLSSLYGTKRWLPGIPTGTGRYKAIFTAWADIAPNPIAKAMIAPAAPDFITVPP